jgi:hypothetical protein
MTHDHQSSRKANGKHSLDPRKVEVGAFETETGPGSHPDGEQTKSPNADDSGRMAEDALMRCYNG